MTFEIRSDDVNVEEIMRLIRKRIEEKKQGLYTDEEIREIAEHRLEAVLEASDVKTALLAAFKGDAARWDFQLDPESIYRSSRGVVGRALETLRRVLKPIQKLFWNPNVLITAVARVADRLEDLSSCYTHLLHNLTVEVTRLNLENQTLKNRVLELQGRLEQQVRREKTLEDMVVYRSDAEQEAKPDDGGAKA